MKQLLFLFQLFLVASCSVVSIDYHMPTTGGYLPEASGTFPAGQAGVKAQADQKVVLAEASSANLFGSNASLTIDSTPKVETSAGVGIYANLGIFNFLDIGYKTSNESTSMLTTTLQLLGSSTKERGVGNKLAISGGVGKGSETESNYQLNDTNTNSVQRDLNGKTESENYEVGLQYGYRVDKNYLPYASVFYTQYEVKGTITSNEGRVYNFQNESWLSSYNVGMLYTTDGRFSYSMQIEVGYVYSKVNDASPGKHDQTTVLVTNSFRF